MLKPQSSEPVAQLYKPRDPNPKSSALPTMPGCPASVAGTDNQWKGSATNMSDLRFCFGRIITPGMMTLQPFVTMSCCVISYVLHVALILHFFKKKDFPQMVLSYLSLAEPQPAAISQQMPPAFLSTFTCTSLHSPLLDDIY